MKIEFFRHNIEPEDIARVNAVLDSIFLTTGKAVEDFENAFAAYLSAKEAIGVTSCTAALHLSLLAYGVRPGDEVITTPMSFCATSNAILHAGAKPVFVDAERETGNIDAGLIPAAITEKTKAIIPVHLYGQMCDMREIRRIAEKHGLVVIEDAAHCIEARRDGAGVGDLGDAACFSFYATKNITSGEGGAIATDSHEKAELLKMLRLHGIDKGASERYARYYQHWDMPVLGWKYNMDNIQAALLIGQLERVGDLWAARDRLWRRYEDLLQGIRGVEILRTVPGSKHARHLFTILVAPEKRDYLLHSLQEKGIGVAVNYRPIHLLKFYRSEFGYREGDYPAAEEIGKRTLSLPLYPKLKDEEAEYVVGTLRDIL